MLLCKSITAVERSIFMLSDVAHAFPFLNGFYVLKVIFVNINMYNGGIDPTTW